MNQQQRQRIIDRHRDALMRHGHHPNALYWSNKEMQELRFRVLTEIGIKTGDSVLDVGCGFGDLSDYFRRHKIEVDYTGVDLSPDLIQKGQAIYPEAKLFSGDIFDLNPEPASFDYVILSGALNEAMNDDGEYAQSVIKQMYQTCRKAVAFNLLNAENKWVANRPDLQSFHPEEMISFCQSLGGHCLLRQDYLDNDFTIQLFHRIPN